MIVVLYIALGMLGIKLLYNIVVPYQLLWKQDENLGVSTMLVVEWVLLGIAVLLSGLMEPDTDWLQFWPLLGIGIGAIVATYLNFVLTMLIGGWLLQER